MKNYIILLVFFFLIGCDPYDNRLTITNNTNHTLIIDVCKKVLDTTIYSENKADVNGFNFSEHEILPHSDKKILTMGSWDNYFEKDTLVILVYNREGILKKRVEKPTEDYDIEKIIYISKDYMDKNDWKVIIDSGKTPRIIKL